MCQERKNCSPDKSGVIGELCRIIQHFESAMIDYKEKPLDRFIEEKVLSGKKKRAGSYQNKGGTISDKITFCQRVLENIKQFEDLSPEAQALTKRIYKFIQSMNP
jgi:hypothetical protein